MHRLFIILAMASVIQLGAPAAIHLSYEDTNTAQEGNRRTLEQAIVEYILSSTEFVGVSVCDVCKTIAAALKIVLHSSKTSDEMIIEAAALCTFIGIMDEPICYTAMSTWLPEIIYITNRTAVEISDANICGMINPECVIVDEFLPVFDWKINISTPEPPYVPPPQPSPTAPKLRILHISDTHYDPEYVEGSVANCNEPLCCRAKSMSPSPDINKAGKFGGVNGSCDIPQITLESMLQYAAQNLQFDFVYWTGDIPPHDIWNQTKEGNIKQLHSTADIIHQYIPSTKIVYPACGNHESEPCNSFPVPPVYQDFNISYLYNELDSVWSSFIPNLQHDTVLKGGYYVIDVRPGLRLISLNMNYGGPGNWWLLVQSQDPTEELKWLIDQLDDAERNNIKVHIIGHIPPGKTTYVWSRNYRDILDRYKGTIAGHFYGHTHDDHFEIIYNDVNTSYPVSVAYIGPSVTTYTNLNPSFRIYTIDGDYNGTTWEVLDYEVYWMDVEKANVDGFPTWELLYTAKQEYGLNDFSPAEWNNFVDRMENDDTLFQTFYQNLHRDFKSPACDGTCKNSTLCDLRLGWSGYSNLCRGG